jgi:2-methylisocitrate lyase-like PEP mutase family enzyme
MNTVKEGIAELEAMLRDYEANVERGAGDPQFVLQARTALLLSTNLEAIERRVARLEDHVGLKPSES